MNDKELLEKRELILSAIRDSLSNEDEKKYYDNLIRSIKSSEVDSDQGLTISRIKRAHVNSKKYCKNVIKDFVNVSDIDSLGKDELVNKYYFMIKNILMNSHNSNGEIDSNYKRDRLVSMLLNTKVVKQFDRKFDNIVYDVDDVGDELIKKGMGRC